MDWSWAKPNAAFGRGCHPVAALRPAAEIGMLGAVLDHAVVRIRPADRSTWRVESRRADNIPDKNWVEDVPRLAPTVRMKGLDFAGTVHCRQTLLPASARRSAGTAGAASSNDDVGEVLRHDATMPFACAPWRHTINGKDRYRCQPRFM